MNALDNIVNIKNWHKDANYPADERLIDMLPESIISQAAAELVQLRKDLVDAQYHLVSMVNQYCMNTVKKDGMGDTYSHSFMSTGEAAFDYLVGHDLARWCANGVDICKLKWPEEMEAQ